MNENKLIKKFLSLSVVSTMGNHCADWALFFYALEKTEFGRDSGLSKASLFYIGFGIGRIVLAPLLGVLFDRFSKKYMSIFVDGSYALLLVIASILFGIDRLNDFAFLAITILIHTFSHIHLQSVGFAAVKKHASQYGGRYLAGMFALSSGLGIAFSGVLFSLIGFYGCMAFAVITFLPILFLYWPLFSKEEPKKSKDSAYFTDFIDSFKFLLKDRILLKFGFILGLFNIVGALFPAYLKLEINSTIKGTDHLSGPILAGGLILAFLFYKKMDIISHKLKGSIAFSMAFLPILLASILAYFLPSIISLTILYLSACFGSGLRNIITANLRTKRIPATKIARVNTVYGTLLNTGPLLGGLFVIPIVEHSIEKGLLIAIGVTGLAFILSFVWLPKQRIDELSKEEVA